MEFSAGELAERLGAVCEGDARVCIRGAAGLREAEAGDISFLGQARYKSHMSRTGASAVVVFQDFDGSFEGTLIRVDNPEEAFQQIATWFAPSAPEFAAGIHPRAIVSPEADVGEDVMVGPNVVIEPGARIGNGCRIHAGCYIGHWAHLGAQCLIHPSVVIRDHCLLGERVILHSGAIIGSDGFGYTVDDQGVRTKIPQIGIVEIGDDVEIGANATVDRARFGRTRIGRGVKIDNLVHVAHNVVLEDDVVLIAQVGLAGSTVVRKRAILGGQVGVAGHLEIGEAALVNAQSGVTKDVPAGSLVTGFPATPHQEAARIRGHLKRIPQLKQRVAELEQRIRELEDRNS